MATSSTVKILKVVTSDKIDVITLKFHISHCECQINVFPDLKINPVAKFWESTA